MGTGDMPQSGSDKHHGGITIRETPHYPGAAPNLPHHPLQRIVGSCIIRLKATTDSENNRPPIPMKSTTESDLKSTTFRLISEWVVGMNRNRLSGHCFGVFFMFFSDLVNVDFLCILGDQNSDHQGGLYWQERGYTCAK
jgi:hypothetical protein